MRLVRRMKAKVPPVGTLEHIAYAVAAIEAIPASPPPKPVRPPKSGPAEEAAAALCLLIGGGDWAKLTEDERAGFRDMASTVLRAWARARRQHARK